MVAASAVFALRNRFPMPSVLVALGVGARDASIIDHPAHLSYHFGNLRRCLSLVIHIRVTATGITSAYPSITPNMKAEAPTPL